MHDDIRQLFDITGKVAMVTGGARHLGYDAASILAAAGAQLIITSREKAQAEESAVKLRGKYGVDALALALDQSKFENVEAAVRDAKAWKGRIDILVNNAGGGSGLSPAWLFDRDPKDIDQMLQLNLHGTMYCCREVGRVMWEQGGGKIINIASIAGMLGRNREMYRRNNMAGQPVDYAAAKGGVISLTMDLAAMLAPRNVFVNCISPGGFARKLSEGFVKDYSERTALGRMGRDGIDLKGAILFLASPASDYVVGHNLVVDGGFAIWH